MGYPDGFQGTPYDDRAECECCGRLLFVDQMNDFGVCYPCVDREEEEA